VHERRSLFARLTITNAEPPGLVIGAVGGAGDLTVLARFAPADAGLRVGIFGWALTATWGGDPACGSVPCADRLPDTGFAATRVRAVKLLGCRSRGGFYTNGARDRKVVALTFDDGPWPDTEAFVKVLERKKVPGTFFLIGEQIRGHEALLQRELRDGDMIGNHTYTHANVAGGGGSAAHQITSTTKAIQHATGGFTPCIFRPPYGASSGSLVSLARGMGMATIEWDVDPTDYSRPGADAVYQRLVGGARNGSILLMHDGGGPRGQTLAALPRVIDTLRSRGYQFQTVTDLLGFAPIYG